MAARLVVAAAGIGGLYLLLHAKRTDYAGHYLAGFGGTLAVFAVPLAWLGPPGSVLRWETVWVVLAAIALGAVLEATVFRVAIFDPIDFVNQSLGAVLAACCVHGEPRSLSRAVLAGVVALVALTAGFQLAFA
jgi:hypothetical protein